MEIIHETPFSAELDEVLDKDGSLARVAILKATFEIDDQNRLNVAEEQVPICFSDEWFADPGASSLIYESDGAYFKPATDIIVIGKVYAPFGRPTKSFLAGFSVGQVSKTVLVLGDRHWIYRSLLGVKISPPEPVIEMPLCWERAFGGEDQFHKGSTNPTMEGRNPVGTGFRVTRSADALEGLALPNFEHPRKRIRSWRNKPPPQGFGFIGRGWWPRVQYAGTYDEVWQRNRMPILPTDFDYRFFNAAPSDQIYPGYLRGGELVHTLNLSPKGEERFELPKIDVTFQGVVRNKAFTIPGLLDTVVLELDRRRVILVWRGKYTVSLNEPVENVRAEALSLDNLPIT